VIDLVSAIGEVIPLLEMKPGVLGGMIINDQTVTMLSLKDVMIASGLVQVGESKTQQSNAA